MDSYRKGLLVGVVLTALISTPFTYKFAYEKGKDTMFVSVFDSMKRGVPVTWKKLKLNASPGQAERYAKAKAASPPKRYKSIYKDQECDRCHRETI